jgi:hypothetical protein
VSQNLAISLPPLVCLHFPHFPHFPHSLSLSQGVIYDSNIGCCICGPGHQANRVVSISGLQPDTYYTIYGDSYKYGANRKEKSNGNGRVDVDDMMTGRGLCTCVVKSTK